MGKWGTLGRDRLQPAFFDDAEAVLSPLREALVALIEESESSEAGRLGIHATLRSRLLRGIESSHTPTSLFHLPGPDGLRKVVDASLEAGARDALARRCLTCIDRYESFLSAEGATREMLQALAGETHSDARRSTVRNSGQAVFKAMSALLGFSADAQVISVFFLPGSSPRMVNMAMIRGFLGLKRWRADARFPISGYGNTPGDAGIATTLDGKRVEVCDELLLQEFCSKPLPQFVRTSSRTTHAYQLVHEDVGQRSATTYFLGELIENAYPELHREGQPVAFDSVIASTPCRSLQFDVYVHPDVWANTSVGAATFNTVPHGPVHEENMHTRLDDQHDLETDFLRESADKLTRSASGVPRYQEMISAASHALGCDLQAMRAYRMAVKYPIHGMQYAMIFTAQQSSS